MQQLHLVGLELGGNDGAKEHLNTLRKTGREMLYLVHFLELLALSCPSYERELRRFAQIIEWKSKRTAARDCKLILAAIEAGYATRREISEKTLIPPDTCHTRIKELVKAGKVRKGKRQIPKRDEETGKGIVGGAWFKNIYTIM